MLKCKEQSASKGVRSGIGDPGEVRTVGDPSRPSNVGPSPPVYKPSQGPIPAIPTQLLIPAYMVPAQYRPVELEGVPAIDPGFQPGYWDLENGGLPVTLGDNKGAPVTFSEDMGSISAAPWLAGF